MEFTASFTSAVSSMITGVLPGPTPMAGVPDDAGSREVWRILEDDAAALYGAVRACERVRSVRGLKVSPETKPLTPRGETAVAAEFEAEMFYCD